MRCETYEERRLELRDLCGFGEAVCPRERRRGVPVEAVQLPARRVRECLEEREQRAVLLAVPHVGGRAREGGGERADGGRVGVREYVDGAPCERRVKRWVRVPNARQTDREAREVHRVERFEPYFWREKESNSEMWGKGVCDIWEKWLSGWRNQIPFEESMCVATSSKRALASEVLRASLPPERPNPQMS